jgi:hypothetical protein
MHTHKISSFAFIRCLAVSIMAVPLTAESGLAQQAPSNYAILVGAGVLCDLGDPSACPAVAKSAEGSSFELTGVGVFDAHERFVTASGTFVHKSPEGNTVETGIWIANELVSFQFYGIAPGALMRAGAALGSSPFGQPQMPMAGRRMLGMPMRLGPMPAGGLAVLRIRLLPLSGFARTATLQVNCALGKVPEERQTEGITLTFERGSGEFDQEISGRTMFVVTRPGAMPAQNKPPATEAEPNPPPARAQQ